MYFNLKSYSQNVNLFSSGVALENFMTLKMKEEIVINALGKEITKPTDKIPYYNVFLPGTRRRIKSKNYTELIEKLFRLLSKGNSNTFEFWFNEALETVAENKGKSGRNNAERLTKSFNSYLDDSFKRKVLTDFTTNFLDEYIRKLIKSKSLTFNELKNLRTVINHAFKKAMSKGVINYNPMSCITLTDYEAMCNDKHTLDRSKNDNNLPFQPFQIAEILRICEERILSFKYYIQGYMIKFSALSGCRTSEICALRWEDINIFTKEIWIHSQILFNEENNEYIYVPHTKDDKKHSGKGRRIPLTDELSKLFKNLREKQESLSIKSDYVFCNSDGSVVHPNNQYQQSLRKICKKLGYNLYRNHAIRKYYNSYVLIPLNIPVESRAKLMGHSIKINLENYSFAYDDYVADTLDKLNSLGTTRDYQKATKKMPEKVNFQAFQQLRHGGFE